MIRHAAQVGANALIGVRYDATEDQPTRATQVLCYGTAVTVSSQQARWPVAISPSVR